MRKISQTLTTLFGLTLFFLGSSAFADTNSATVAADAVTNHTDRSLAFLGSVFGTVGSSLQGSSGQMLGKLFHEFNVGVLCVVGFLMAYTVLTIVFKSATEGSFMGANKNVHIVILRIALGTAFLIPSPSTGYCLLQDVVMQVVVKSVALADMVWDNGISYIQNGGSVWHPPVTAAASAGQATIISPTAAAKIEGFVIFPVYRDEVCMAASSIKSYLQGNQSHAAGGGAYMSPSSGTDYEPIQGDGKTLASSKYSFPGIQGGDGGCGTVSWVLSKGEMQPNSVGNKMSQQAMYVAVNNLLDTAKAEACSQMAGSGAMSTPVCQGRDTSDLATNAPQVMFSTLMGYVNAVMPIAQQQTAQSNASLQAFLASAKTAGWMMAGRYYWDLMQVQDNYVQAVDISSYVPSPNGVNPPADGSQPSEVQNAWKNTLTKMTQEYLPTINDPNKGYLRNYSDASNAGSPSSSGGWNNVNTGVFAALDAGLSTIGGSVRGIINNFNLGNRLMSNPIYFLHSIGVECLSSAGTMLVALAATAAALGAATMICQATANASEPLEMGFDWIRPLAITVGMALLSVGAVLAIYVPFYPFLIFLFAFIGWIVSVVEAMAAAPLVAYGLTHPEGHDFLGEAKQGLMLLLGVFLRPALIVIGMIASMILTFVAFRILIFTFSGVCTDLMSTVANSSLGSSTALGAMANGVNSVGNGAGLASFIVGPILLVVFAGITFMLINQCFSLVYVLPDYIMRWIGGPQTSSMAAELAGKMQGITSSAGSTAGNVGFQAGGQSLDKMRAGMGKRGKMGRKMYDKFKGKGATSSNSGSSHQ